MGEDLERLKQRIPLLEYLQRHHWTGHRAGTRSEFVGLCPLHEETHPSFYVNPRKNLFYCHGCGRGGDLIRLVELSQHLSFRQSVTYSREELAPTSQLLEHTAGFYQLELHRHPEGIHYLAQRGVHDPALIEELGIGYARGGNLRPHLSNLGYSLELLLQAGLIGQQGQDAFCRRVIFPCRQHHRIVNLYGRSVGAAFPHRLLPRSKGGLFAWESVRLFPQVILVEGLLDLAVLWQEGFRNTTCAIGTHLTPPQLAQLCENRDRSVYLAFDQDDNQAGQRAAQVLAQRLQENRLRVRIVHLPAGHDPNSYFAAGATKSDFILLRSGSIAMTLRLVVQNAVPASASPYRLLDEHDREIAWANDFLDAQRLRQLSPRSLRAYAYDLLHFARWLQPTRRPLAKLQQSCLLDYVRSQLDREPKPTPSTINHRLGVVRGLYRFHYGQEIPAGKSHFRHTYTARSSLGYGRPQPKLATGLRLRQPRRVVVPLSADEVARFWKGFRTFRDLALLALLLLDGLRSCELLHLQLEDLCFSEAQLRVLGKGNKKRVLPLPAETIEVLQNYLRLERPLTNSPALFVSLKGRQRGRPMTAAGLRSLFRHHRRASKVPQANPHRFRHTFGTDMVRAGISLPALMHLMGHAHIHTTMLYVELAPQDVWREYARAVAQRIHLSATEIS